MHWKKTMFERNKRRLFELFPSCDFFFLKKFEMLAAICHEVNFPEKMVSDTKATRLATPTMMMLNDKLAKKNCSKSIFAQSDFARCARCEKTRCKAVRLWVPPSFEVFFCIFNSPQIQLKLKNEFEKMKSRKSLIMFYVKATKEAENNKSNNRAASIQVMWRWKEVISRVHELIHGKWTFMGMRNIQTCYILMMISARLLSMHVWWVQIGESIKATSQSSDAPAAILWPVTPRECSCSLSEFNLDGDTALERRRRIRLK